MEEEVITRKFIRKTELMRMLARRLGISIANMRKIMIGIEKTVVELTAEEIEIDWRGLFRSRIIEVNNSYGLVVPGQPGEWRENKYKELLFTPSENIKDELRDPDKRQAINSKRTKMLREQKLQRGGK